MSSVLRKLPSVNDLLESPPLKSLVGRLSRNVVVTRVGRFLDDFRGQVQDAAVGMNIPTARELAERIARWIDATEPLSLQPVINATGVLLPMNLGAAPLAEEAIQWTAHTSGSYSNFEVDLSSGEHSPGISPAQRLLTKLAGAESAAVLNNCASALWLAFAALSSQKEVVVSRGQLGSLADGSSVPELIAAAGARLREAGTTNKTRAEDVASQLSGDTGAILRVKNMQFALGGDVEEASLEDLVRVGKSHRVPVIDVVELGTMADLRRWGIQNQVLLSNSIKAGADLVITSGNMALGGPECGIVLGRKALVNRIIKHPLWRVFQPDKLTLAALEATLRLYEDPEVAEQSIPILALLARPLENLRNRAQRMAPQIQATGVATAEVVEGSAWLVRSKIPSDALPSIEIALTPASGSAESLESALRTSATPILVRRDEQRLFLNMRTIQPPQDMQIVAAFEALSASRAPEGN